MNEIQTQQQINNLTSEILILKQQTAQNIIEIGKRLIQVKESLPHGEWGNWLKEKADFTDRTAQRFMKAAREFSNSTSLSGLGSSKLFALLDLPQEERENFIEQPHEIEGKTKTVDEMTTRELQKVIKEKKELENKLKNEKKRLEDFEKEIQKIRNENKDKLTNSEVEITNLKLHIEMLNKKMTVADESNNSDEVDKLHQELEQAQDQLQEALKKVNDLEEQVKNKPIDVTYTDKLDSKNTAIVKYEIIFDHLVKDFKSLLDTLPEMKESNSEEYEKYKGATLKLLDKMKESLV